MLEKLCEFESEQYNEFMPKMNYNVIQNSC
jgi:hypothetical protein